MPFLGSVESTTGFGRPVRPRAVAPAPVATGGSLSFSGASNSYLTIANDIDLRMGTGDFTIEWWQYAQTVGNSFPRIFSIGSFSSQSIAVSQEGSDSSRTFYFWGSNANSIESGQNYTGKWVHFAISRSGTTVRVFRNGTQIGSNLTISTNFANTTNTLAIGNESSPSTGAAFKGLITNFRWVKGTAVYTSNFTVPTQPLTAIANTKLLLLASSSGAATTDSSAAPKTVTNTNVTWSSSTPF
jgi:hypothetical protein